MKKFEFSDDYVVQTRINGQLIEYRPAKMDQSWLERFIEKGIQRYANDMYSAEKGNTKYDLCKEIAAQANSGEAAPEKAVRKASLPDDVALAVKNAKADLKLLFQKLTGKGKIADQIDHEKVKPFFDVKADSVTWNDKKVLEWIEKRKEAGKDYLAEAKESLTATESVEDLL